MARPHVYTWPLLSETSVCALQSTAGAGSLIINGSLAQPSYPDGSGPAYVKLTGIARTISIKSANNNAAINFTITGTFNGRAQTVTIAGPNATTVYTTGVYFDSITSVTVNGAANAVSLGTGTTGVSSWFNSDIYSPALGLAIQVVRVANITYSFETTLDDVQTVTSPTTFTPIAALTGATTNQLGSYLVPTASSRILVTASDATGTLVATFVQQGLS